MNGEKLDYAGDAQVLITSAAVAVYSRPTAPFFLSGVLLTLFLWSLSVSYVSNWHDGMGKLFPIGN